MKMLLLSLTLVACLPQRVVSDANELPIGCRVDGDCALGRLCVQNECTPGCRDDLDCPEGMGCSADLRCDDGSSDGGDRSEAPLDSLNVPSADAGAAAPDSDAGEDGEGEGEGAGEGEGEGEGGDAG